MQEFKKYVAFGDCAFCTGERGMKDRIYNKSNTISMLGDEIEIEFKNNDAFTIYNIYIPVKYCPMCGREV